MKNCTELFLGEARSKNEEPTPKNTSHEPARKHTAIRARIDSYGFELQLCVRRCINLPLVEFAHTRSLAATLAHAAKSKARARPTARLNSWAARNDDKIGYRLLSDVS